MYIFSLWALPINFKGKERTEINILTILQEIHERKFSMEAGLIYSYILLLKFINNYRKTRTS